MANQLQMDSVFAILALRRRDLSVRRIARELGIHRETVGRYIRLADARSKPATDAPAGSKVYQDAPTGSAPSGGEEAGVPSVPSVGCMGQLASSSSGGFM